jgi:hypothetical protein
MSKSGAYASAESHVILQARLLKNLIDEDEDRVRLSIGSSLWTRLDELFAALDELDVVVADECEPILPVTPCPGAALKRVVDGTHEYGDQHLVTIAGDHPLIGESISVFRILGAYFQGVADHSDSEAIVDSAVAYGEWCSRMATQWEDLA